MQQGAEKSTPLLQSGDGNSKVESKRDSVLMNQPQADRAEVDMEKPPSPIARVMPASLSEEYVWRKVGEV